jgi:2-methylisocitrate lyase-like PEP mutase family enzyme
MSASQTLAQTLRALHVPGNPIMFTNIWDAPSALIALSHPKTKALATASFAIAASLGLKDDDLTMDDNMAAISRIVRCLQDQGKATTVP